MATETLSDEAITKMAKARVEFRQHAAAYVIVNALLIGIWFVTRGDDGFTWQTFWPIWALLGWGVGLAFHGVNAYGSGSAAAVAREEDKIRRKQG